MLWNDLMMPTTVPKRPMKGALLPMVPEGTFLAYLFGAIDVFLIWWVLVLAIGLAVLYRRRTQPVAVTLFVIYGVIALCYAGVRSWMGGS